MVAVSCPTVWLWALILLSASALQCELGVSRLWPNLSLSTSCWQMKNGSGWTDGPVQYVLYPLVIFFYILSSLSSEAEQPAAQSRAVSLSFRRRRRAGWANGRADRPPPRRCTSWWPCWGSAWRGGWWGRGTAPGNPPLWVLSVVSGRRSGTCCPPLVAVCESPLQLKSRKRKVCWIVSCSL